MRLLACSDTDAWTLCEHTTSLAGDRVRKLKLPFKGWNTLLQAETFVILVVLLYLTFKLAPWQVVGSECLTLHDASLLGCVRVRDDIWDAKTCFFTNYNSGLKASVCFKQTSVYNVWIDRVCSHMVLLSRPAVKTGRKACCQTWCWTLLLTWKLTEVVVWRTEKESLRENPAYFHIAASLTNHGAKWRRLWLLVH